MGSEKIDVYFIIIIVNNDFLEKGILSRLKKRINWFVKYARGRSSFAKLQEFARG